MSKSKYRTPAEYCADCGAQDPTWASINRGVFMCNECAGLHRNLGRHVSQVKHVQKSHWHPNQLNMVHQLATVGANSIWEHSLLDPAQLRSGKRKPNPTDSSHSVKNEFIRAKYEQLAFVHRPPRRDDDDLGKQLHSSVRTANLDTSLRLLSLGAHANYFHQDRGNTPLHVAAKAGQALQVELLVTYGADPAALDSNKQTPEDLARAEGHSDLADRIVELQYELSDRLSVFVWNKRPDHKTGKHYTIPKARDNGVGVDGRKRLQALSNQIFEELAMDVYDEIDRRETEKIWQEIKQAAAGKVAPTADHVAVPFLPVNPEYSTTRNQGRQKLARFSEQEFGVLVNDILHDIIRRQAISDGVSPKPIHFPISEEPIYDLPPENLDYQSIEDSCSSIQLGEFISLKQKLKEAEDHISRLNEENRDLSDKVTSLAKQNHELSKKQQQSYSVFKPPTGARPHGATGNSPLNPITNGRSRPTSSYKPDDSVLIQDTRRNTIHEASGSIPLEDTKEQGSDANSDEKNKKIQGSHLREASPHNSVGSDYDNNNVLLPAATDGRRPSLGNVDQDSDKGSSKNGNNSDTASNSNENNNNTAASQNLLPSSAAAPETSSSSNSPHPGDQKDSLEDAATEKPTSLPPAAEVIRKTDAVTKMLQNLVQVAQRSKLESYQSCADNIFTAVKEIIALFPEDPGNSEVKAIIGKLGDSAQMLRTRCAEIAEQGPSANSKQATEIIIKTAAYEIAKAEKDLVTMTTKLHAPAPAAPPTSST